MPFAVCSACLTPVPCMLTCVISPPQPSSHVRVCWGVNEPCFNYQIDCLSAMIGCTAAKNRTPMVTLVAAAVGDGGAVVWVTAWCTC